jgi:hypothetical protein
VFEELIEKREGWEWDEGEQGSSRSAREGDGLDVGQADGAPQAGISHSEMCNLVDALGQPDPDWETVEREGRKPLFVPSKELANWAYRCRDTRSDRFQEAARRVVTLRARHEGRKLPLNGE